MVDKIRELCKERGTSIFKLEKTLGIGNGTISRWDKSTPKLNNLQSVADALGVSVAYLTGESEQKEMPTVKDDGPISAEDVKLLLSKMSVTDLQSLMGEIAAEMAGRAK